MHEEQHDSSQHWHIQALGALRADRGAGLQPITREAPRRLLAYLIIARQAPVARERLSDALWPDLPIDQGRRRLADAVYQLRRSLPAGALEATGDLIALRRDLRVDAWAFERLAAGSDPAELRVATSLYTGDLLPEIYDDWAIGPRAAACERWLDGLAQLADAEPDAAQAATLYQRLLEADPLRETAHTGLMRALARAGRPAEALAAYEGLVHILADSLGVPPGETARKLADRLRAQLSDAHQAAVARPHRLARPPFVGRAAERAALLGRLDAAAAGHGGLALLVGEAGIGKTRLAEEIAGAAIWRGWQPFWGRGRELTIAPPFAPLSQALAAALPTPRRQQLRRIAPADALALVEQMVWPTRIAEPLAATAERADYQRLAAALDAVLAGLAGVAPPLLILDDVQWSAPDLWPLLEALRPLLAARRALVLVLGRAQELRAGPEAHQALAHWSTQGETFISLGGLTPDELAELASASGVAASAPGRLEQLASASGGNPLLALTWLGAESSDSAGPRSPAELAARRLALLSAPARRAVEVAAVIGAQIAYPIWEAVLGAEGLPPADLPALAGELERTGLLMIEERGYRFAHDSLRTAVYAQLSAPLRRREHLHTLAALRALAPDDQASMLHHAEGAGDRAALAHHAQAVGERSLAAASYAAARQAFERALGALDPAAHEARYAASAGLVASLEVLAERGPQRDASALMAELAELLGDDRRRAEAAWRRAGLEWAVGHFTEAEQIARAGLAAAERHGDRRLQALLSEIAGRSARDLGHYERAEQAFFAARAAYEQLGDARGAAWIDGMLGLVAQRQGRLRAAIELQTRAAAAFRSAGDPYHELRVLSGLAIALWWSGDYLSARTMFERILELSAGLGDGRMQEAGLHNLGALADLLGDYEAALALKTRALARSRAAENPMGVAVGLCNLGITYFKLDRYAEALAALAEALDLDRASGRRAGEAFCLYSQGQVFAADGQHADARRSFEAARLIRSELGERDLLLDTEAELTLLALAEGDLAAARGAVDGLLARLAPGDRADVREHVAYTAYRVLSAVGETEQGLGQLQRAAAAMHELLDALPAEARARLLERDPLHRAVHRALAASAQLATVRLVRAGVPLGRRLTEADYITVRWSIASHEDGRFARADERRRHVLRRLLRQAAEQGAAPTDADLAGALGVSRRTVLRDMAALAATGDTTPTRRRVSQ